MFVTCILFEDLECGNFSREETIVCFKKTWTNHSSDTFPINHKWSWFGSTVSEKNVKIIHCCYVIVKIGMEWSRDWRRVKNSRQNGYVSVSIANRAGRRSENPWGVGAQCTEILGAKSIKKWKKNGIWWG